MKNRKIWYSSLIYDSLNNGLPVSLFIADDGSLGVKIDDVELPYFAWESFEDIVDDDEAYKRVMLIKNKIIEEK